MRVLQINATYGYGSTGLIIRDIGDALTALLLDAVIDLKVAVKFRRASKDGFKP